MEQNIAKINEYIRNKVMLIGSQTPSKLKLNITNLETNVISKFNLVPKA